LFHLTGERDDELLARTERRVRVVGGEPVGGVDLVGGGEAKSSQTQWLAREGRPHGDDAVGDAWRVEVKRVPATVDFAVAPQNTTAARNNSRSVALESRSARSRGSLEM
jgi:hypothetical protein